MMEIPCPFNKDRSEVIGQYIVDTGATVRAAAAKFGISKSTVHKDMTERLRDVNHALYVSVGQVLAVNKQERHLRGGEATKQKYRSMRKTKPSPAPKAQRTAEAYFLKN